MANIEKLAKEAMQEAQNIFPTETMLNKARQDHARWAEEKRFEPAALVKFEHSTVEVLRRLALGLMISRAMKEKNSTEQAVDSALNNALVGQASVLVLVNEIRRLQNELAQADTDRQTAWAALGRKP